MRGQRVSVCRGTKKGREVGTGGALVAGASTASSPAVPKKWTMSQCPCVQYAVHRFLQTYVRYGYSVIGVGT